MVLLAVLVAKRRRRLVHLRNIKMMTHVVAQPIAFSSQQRWQTHLCRHVDPNYARPGSHILEEKLSQVAGVAFHYRRYVGFDRRLAGVINSSIFTVLVHIALHIHAQNFALFAE